MKGYLVLEDGTWFEGEYFGRAGVTVGEVVFSTGMTGYQEVLTDPSYCGHIVTMTYPLIGNYGTNRDDNESKKPALRAFVVREVCSFPSNYRNEQNLPDYLEEHGVIGLQQVDTRALTRHLRQKGAMWGAIAPDYDQARELSEKPRRETDLVREVTTDKPIRYPGSGLKVVVLDFGVKKSIINNLLVRRCAVTVLPAWSSAAAIRAERPDLVLLSNGPGDPKAAGKAIETARELIGKVPLAGICLGHQILTLALGGDTYKLKYGHRGANHPVKDVESGRVYITTQNHGYAVDPAGLPDDIEVTHVNLNDRTVEGIRHKYLPVRSVQYHPEAAPGPGDSSYLFDEILGRDFEGVRACP